MKRIRIVGLCLVAAFALSAVAASAAFGASTFLGKGGASPKGITFKGEGGKAFFESKGGNKIECEKSKSAGEFLSELEAKVTSLEYSGNCKLSGIVNSKCTEPIKTKELKVLAGSEVGEPKTRLEVFLPKSGTVMAELTCGEVKVKVTGGVVCKNIKFTLGLKGEVECKQTAAGVQAFNEAETDSGVIKDSLEAESTLGVFKLKEADAQTTTEKLTFSAEVEQMEG